MLRALVVAIILALMGQAWALEQHDHAQLGAAGDFYGTWKRPNPGGPRTASCCSLQDCHQALVRGSAGHWEFMSRATGRWRVLPEVLLEHNQDDPRESPDGLPHVCEDYTGKILCAVIGDGI